MTRIGATIATVGSALGAPLLVVGAMWLASHTLFWWVVLWAFLAVVAGVVLFGIAAAFTELWLWFRRDGWKQ